MQGIYEIRNVVNGKRYVGSAADILRRWRRHRKDLRGGRHHSALLQRSWAKHGEQCFEFAVLAIVESSAELIATEQRYIDQLGAFGARGYNSVPLAASPAGRRHTPEAIAKIRAAMQRKRGPATALQRARWSEVRTGRVATEQARANMSAARLGKPMSEAHRAKMREVSIIREQKKREARA